ncbi:MAG: TRAP transporter substrate-binding protein [Firmicutes bacterium]|nr:TRAP transporter substrate-binding protein [Bacillota bacterium]
MRSRKIGLLLLILIMIVVTCSGAQLMAATKVCKLAEVHPPDYPTAKGDSKFAELVEKYTNGRYKIQCFFNSQLGSENDVVEQAKLGVIEFTRVSIAPVVTVYPEIGVFTMPFIFTSQEHQWKVLNGPIGQHFLDQCVKANLIGLGYFEAGARHFYANKPLDNLASLKGLKIRVQPSPVPVTMVKLLGAIPTPIAYGEVYSALQTGVVDGAENNYPSWVTQNHCEVAKYLIQDAHLRQPEIMLASKKFWDTLSKADQAAIRRAMKEATEYQIKEWNNHEFEALEQAKARGCIVKPANIAEFQAAMAPIYDMPEYKIYKEWIEKIKATK